MLGCTADRTSDRTTVVVVLDNLVSLHGFENAVPARSFVDCHLFRDGTATRDQDTLERNARDADTNNKHRSHDPTMCLHDHNPVRVSD